MKKIILSNSNKFALIDDEDYWRVVSHTWYLDKGKNGERILSRINTKLINLGKFILNTIELVDHKDRNPLNNQKENLRKCTYIQNSQNRAVRVDSESGIKGATYDPRTKKYMVRIKVNKEFIWLGRHDTLEEAAKAYNKAAIKYFGEFAWLNPI